VADTIHTRILARAAEAEGGKQALAHLLRVPENTLERWMSGRAQMPLQAFLKLLEILTQHEARGHLVAPSSNAEPLTFAMGQLQARCTRCDGTEFVPAEPDKPLRFTAALLCRSCGERVVHGDLIAQLARDAVHQSRAMTVARSRRQSEALRRSPKLRALKEASREEKKTLPD
jgi:hypothetical protein